MTNGGQQDLMSRYTGGNDLCDQVGPRSNQLRGWDGLDWGVEGLARDLLYIEPELRQLVENFLAVEVQATFDLPAEIVEVP